MKLTATLRDALARFAPTKGQYESTLSHLMPAENPRVLVLGTGKASQFHNKVALDYGTNIVGAVSPNKGGSEFLGKPVFGTVDEAVRHLRPSIISLFVPPPSATDAILSCLPSSVPLLVAYAEGIPLHSQLTLQAALRSQGSSRLLGPNCPGLIVPPLRLKLGIQPLAVHRAGRAGRRVGLASRSGTLSYELASAISSLEGGEGGWGQSCVFGLGGDPFPGTRTWEALEVMLKDERTDIVVLVGEIGGQMEEEAAAHYLTYRSSLPPDAPPKPVVGYVAGRSAAQGKTYGHAGAVWWDEAEGAGAKGRVWREAGIRVARGLGDVVGLVQEAGAELERVQKQAQAGT